MLKHRKNNLSVNVIECLEPRRLLSSSSIVAQLGTITPVTASTVPANGDENPYGIAFVPDSFPAGGTIHGGDLLIANFNASSNLQGTGTTIDRVKPNGKVSTFFRASPASG